MIVEEKIRQIETILKKDEGVSGEAQKIEQIGWILFLKIYDMQEELWEFYEESYSSIIPKQCRWRNWAKDAKNGKAITGQELLEFVNNTLFPTLKEITINEKMNRKSAIVKYAFMDIHNYMKDGILLRQLINLIDEISCDDKKQKEQLKQFYEIMLSNLRKEKETGEFYTPRPITNFMASKVRPKLGEKIADFACGTGGTLTSSLEHLEKQIKTIEDRRQYERSIYGSEKKALPYLLCIINMLLHGIEEPYIEYNNSLSKHVREYKEDEKYNVIIINPPYGGIEKDNIKSNFPTLIRSNETSDLFLNLALYRLKEGGRAAVILPDGFLFGLKSARVNIKQKLLKEYNLHTIIRIPRTVFAPYSIVATNILFFDKTTPTKEIWFYRMDLPDGFKGFSKTKPIEDIHFEQVNKWWNNRKEIKVDGFDKAKKYTVEQIKNLEYNMDLCGYPNKEEKILLPEKIIQQYCNQRKELEEKLKNTLEKIKTMLEE